LLFRFEPPPQQPQFGPCVLVRFGLSADLSLVACACRVALETTDKAGTLIITLGDEAPQSGQLHGSENWLIGTISSNSPQSSHMYS